MAATPGRAFYERQIALLEAGDVEGLMGQYHEDATLVTFEATVAGLPALREYFRGYLARLGSLRLKSTDRFAETADSILFEATVVTDLGEARVYDVFVLREGRATHHFAGVIALTPR